MNSIGGIKTGDKIVVLGYRPVIVSRIYRENAVGQETESVVDTASIRLELDWGGGMKSRVSLHDKGRVWYSYAQTN
jgi:hypothetical protein